MAVGISPIAVRPIVSAFRLLCLATVLAIQPISIGIVPIPVMVFDVFGNPIHRSFAEHLMLRYCRKPFNDVVEKVLLVVY